MLKLKVFLNGHRPNALRGNITSPVKPLRNFLAFLGLFVLTLHDKGSERHQLLLVGHTRAVDISRTLLLATRRRWLRSVFIDPQTDSRSWTHKRVGEEGGGHFQ